ncbi:targeting protein for Xklp2 homolog [Apis laboriosa]|uniref:targeting protein for Xklp2 homolog n=1 Tax=Apis laboriosa TaxID=183418 RepID=UPI001CC52BC0|nr:targeting protein for Xklp2 homolog [Apis laboriosa]
MMDNCCAPQWADFTHSPQVPSDSYFEVEHEVHKPQIYLKSTTYSNSSLSCLNENKNDQSITEVKFDDSLETESPARNSVAYFIPYDNKKHSVGKKNENESKKSLKNFTLDERSNKIHQTWNIPITELTSAFKVMKSKHTATRIIPEKIKKNIYLSESKHIIHKSKDVQDNDIMKKNNSQINFTKIEEKSMKSKIEKNIFPKKQSNTSMKQCSLGKSQSRVLTCQYRRTSLIKCRKRSNQFISLAEAILKFQNGTPQRFRTLSNKDLKPTQLMKLKRSPLKLTYPISPALRCKQRIRQTKILNPEKREMLMLEEMKKYKIKANPVPINILKNSSILKKVDKKSATITEKVTEKLNQTQSKKTRHTTNSQLNLQEQKKIIPIVRSMSTSNIVKKENTCIESTVESTKLKRLNFETRNKEFQKKKEEKLKNLQIQETNSIKTEFHAKPAPKFLKSNPVKEQNTKKRIVVPCPFSFEERNKSLANKKKELVKQLQEQNQKSRVFHANPVPNFKPVVIHGLSKENLHSKEKYNSKQLEERQTKNCNDQENKQPNIMNVTIDCIDTKKKQIKQHVNHLIKPIIKNEKSNNDKKKTNKFELNEKKEIQESEFDKKLSKKKEELKAKKLEEEKSKLLKEKLERAELRKMTEVKARPMPVYKSLIAKSTKLPTNPQTPARTKTKSVS